MIRLMKKEDAPQAAALEKLNFSMPWSERDFESALEQGNSVYVVCEEQGQIIGICGLLISFDEADVLNVSVHPDFRRRGLAREMMLALMQYGKERGVKNFTLEVRLGNTGAIELYHSLGFCDEGVRPGFYEAPKEDALIMWKRERETVC